MSVCQSGHDGVMEERRRAGTVKILAHFRQSIGPLSDTATRRAESHPGSGGIPTRSPRRI